MENLKLVIPTVTLKNSFYAMLQDWKSANEPLSPWSIGLDTSNFEKYVNTLLDASKGIGMGYLQVPHSSFWLIDENQNILATSNLRHTLNEKLWITGGHIGYGVTPSARRKGCATKILELTLLEAKKIGIEKALITCNKSNIGSAKSILKNGGEFWKETPMANRITQYYWISIL
ncbi:MAG: GNAT family N-acetyltransferase [Saprospiraceae bacterium]